MSVLRDKMNKSRIYGQSLLEIIFAVVMVGLMLTGLVALITKSTGVQNKSNRHDEAVTLSKIVMEEMVALSKNDPTVFWQQTDAVNQTRTGYGGFSYDVEYTPIGSGGDCTTAGRCTQVLVTVHWQEDVAQEVSFSRFFSR